MILRTLAVLVLSAAPTSAAAQKPSKTAPAPKPFSVVEATIPEMRAALEKASGRIRGLQASVAEHEKNVEALKKELGALKP